jgi:endonuclease/exonuclease/phosphatase family metal-dependent hydrolase
MKLITLNIWGGHVRQPLLEFIKANDQIDIFCFQEVYHQAQTKVSTEDREVSLNIFSELQSLLPAHKGYFRPAVNDIYGISIFVKNNISVLDEGEISIYHNPNYSGLGPTHSRNLQWVDCVIDDQKYTILNLHGLWNGQGKNDCPERLKQSQRIKDFMETIKTPKILCGDFNLRPDVESMKILEEKMNNLIKMFNITSTRTTFYTKTERFADYILTSPEIVVNQFAVLKDEVSDHAPLFIDFI